MFVETQHLDGNSLRVQKNLLFEALEAYTSFDFLDITVVCSRGDLAQVCSTLKEMIFTWQCNEIQFQKVKEDIITEIKDAKELLVHKSMASLKDLALEEIDLIVNVTGDEKTIHALTFSELQEITHVWQTMLKYAPRSLLVAGPTLAEAEINMLDEVLEMKHHTQSIPLRSPIPFGSRYFRRTETHAVVINTAFSSLFFLLFQRLYSIRHMNLNTDWEFSFARDTNHLFYLASATDDKPLDDSAVEKFFLRKPTNEEFLLIQRLLVQELDTLNDGIYPKEIIGWMDIFQVRNIPETQKKTFSEIQDMFRVIPYLDFLHQWKKVFGHFKKK